MAVQTPHRIHPVISGVERFTDTYAEDWEGHSTIWLGTKSVG